jgi:hypothetical protein
MPEVIPQTEIDIDQLKADFGDFYLNSGQNLSNLHMLPYESFETMDAFTVVPTNDTIIRESNVEVEEILQQYQDEFTPKGKVEFQPVEFMLRQIKIDLEFNPTKLQRSWVGFLASNNIDRTQYPFVRWLFEQYVFMKSKEDMEKKAIYKGIYAAPQDGVAGEASKVMDGVRQVVTNFLADGKDVQEIISGAPAVDPATFVTQLENWAKALPEKYRRMVMSINLSRTLEERFVEGMQQKYNMHYAQVGQLKRIRNYENLSLVGRPSMEGEEGWWATPKYNALMGVKGFENSNAIKIEGAKRKVSLYTDWYAAIYFIQPKLLFVNDKVSY